MSKANNSNLDESLETETVETPKTEKAKPSKVNSAFNRILTKLIVLVVLLIVLGFLVFQAGIYIKEKLAISTFQARSAMVNKELLKCAELCTIKANYCDIVTIKKNVFFAKSYSIVRYNGVARAGIQDISNIQAIISEDLNSITIKMPSCELLSNDITAIEMFDESANIFVNITKDEVFAEIQKSRNFAAEELIQTGLIQDANTHAKALLDQVFSAMGFIYVNIEVVDNPM